MLPKKFEREIQTISPAVRHVALSGARDRVGTYDGIDDGNSAALIAYFCFLSYDSGDNSFRTWS